MVTSNNDGHSKNRPWGLFGQGAKLDQDKLKKWAINKSILVKLIPVLIDIAESKKRNRKFIQSLWNTYHCANSICMVNGSLFTSYCKNKLCSICNGIKKAKLVKSYLPIVNQWDDPHLVTLTIKSIYKYKLTEYLYKGMNRGLSKILRKYARIRRNNNGKLLMGIKSLECNYNPIKRTYNPHFHILVPDKETAEILVNEWLVVCKGLAGPKSQNIKKVKNIEKDLIEVIKYSTKIFTDPEMKKNNSNKDYKIYASSIENIIHSFGRTKRHGHFGFTFPKSNKSSKFVDIKTDIKKYQFNKSQNNWVNTDDPNETLTSKDFDRTKINKLDTNIDTDAE